MNKKLLIFDMDGVIFDTIPFAKQAYMDRHPGLTDEMYRSLHAGNFYEEAKKYEYLKRHESEAETAAYLVNYSIGKSQSRIFDGVKELLQELHTLGYTLILNTNAFERNCLPLLERQQLTELFDLIAAADLSTSKVEKFNMITDKYQVAAEDMLFITDSLGDIREADVAQVPTIAVTWGVHDESYFKREPHPNVVGIVYSVEELRALCLRD